MKYLVIAISITLALGLSACGYKEGVRTGALKAHLYFTGDVSNAEVSIDKGEKFSVKEGKDNLYTLEPGKHLVEVYKDNQLKVRREIFVSDGISKEIEVH